MKPEISTHLNDPAHLESLYRNNRAAFKQAFNDLLPAIKGNIIAEYWDARLNHADEPINWGSRKELLFVVVAAAIAGLLAQFPVFFGIDEAFFYPRNIGFIVFLPLAMYFAWRHNLPTGKLAFLIGTVLVSLAFINLLPNDSESDIVVLSCLHLVLVLWSMLGFAFGGHTRQAEPRIRFLTYNGDLLVMMALIAISGGILSGITVTLFAAIGLHIEDIYFQYVGITGAVAVPLVATYLTQSNPQLVGKVSPVIARIFCPLVLVMLVIYLAAMVYGGKNPYTDRDFLLIFNIMLIGVMAIIFFSIAGTYPIKKNRVATGVITLLAAVATIVNVVALSAILFRITEWGITPNRTAVLGANILVLINLILVLVQLIRVLRGNAPITSAQHIVARYLPIYCLWALIVTFLFPVVFGL